MAEMQFRIVSPGLAGLDGVSPESTNLPGRYLRRTSAGTVVLAAEDGSDEAFAGEASFTQGPGLSDESGVSFLAAEGEYIRVGVGGVLLVGAVTEEDGGHATFFIEWSYYQKNKKNSHLLNVFCVSHVHSFYLRPNL